MSKSKAPGWTLVDRVRALVSPKYRVALEHRERQNAHERALLEVRRLGGKIFPIAGGINVHLSHSNVGDDELEILESILNLKELRLIGTPISDRGLVHIGALNRLTMLDLRDTQITDKGVLSLRSLKHLETLDLAGTKVTEAAIEDLKLALPKVHIVRTT